MNVKLTFKEWLKQKFLKELNDFKLTLIELLWIIRVVVGIVGSVFLFIFSLYYLLYDLNVLVAFGLGLLCFVSIYQILHLCYENYEKEFLKKKNN